MSNYILGVDQSTSGTKVLLVNNEGMIIHKKSKGHKQIYPKPGWVEHDPKEIYENVKVLIDEVIKESGVSFHEIKVCSITNQRETAVVWNRETGEPIYNAVVWQCRRTTADCQTLKEKGFEQLVQTKTGLTIDPYFSATKISWILSHVKDARYLANQGKLLVGTIDSWLIWKLTAGKIHATDYTNASRTLLYNIYTLEWDKDLLEIFDIPESMLGEVKNSDSIFGYIEDESLSIHSLPISGVIGDSQGALFGQKCFEMGSAKATYGTGTSVMMHTGKPIKATNGLVTTIAWGLNGKINYALEGIINSTGDTINWIKNELQLIQSFDEVESLADSLPDNQGVYLIPAFVGLGAPYWSPSSKAAIIGISRNTTKSHFIRAAVESIAYQVKDIIHLMETESDIKLTQLKVDGGATKNLFLMNFQAGILNKLVITSGVPELSSMGSIYLAGLGIGMWSSTDELELLAHNDEKFEPMMNDEDRDIYYNGWKMAIEKIVVK
ncbi:glycerol kinase GlpK [Evansella tamaricis]|uniref:ATP:glycerol 3-phosphotransferase n=1 Tax=Evansella tamaricis TaxID=2069301 RepID=A0ABS6JCR8_9BACI|nr:glycerol kinase GlpK [Evansella tamaricis]MBU9711225.1 glycerol kinase GlpK [Evansella tamaricis]